MFVEEGVSGDLIDSFRKELPDVDGWKVMPSHAKMSMVFKRTLPAKYRRLLKVALCVTAMHATSCSAERLWALMRWVYGDNRSRLGIEKAKKLVMVTHYQRMLRKETFDVAAEEPMLDSLFGLE